MLLFIYEILRSESVSLGIFLDAEIVEIDVVVERAAYIVVRIGNIEYEKIISTLDDG